MQSTDPDIWGEELSVETNAHNVAENVIEINDLDAIRKAVDDAGSICSALWLTYLFFLFYLAVAVAGVTNRDLLLESSVKLPFLGVDLPLVAFFFVAPLLFMVSHVYTLIHFVLLATKAGRYNVALRALVVSPTHREVLRRQLPSNIFVQRLVGPRESRKGPFGSVLRAIVWLTLVIAPILLLLLIQIRFLPYHHQGVTWIHRLSILADIAVIWISLPSTFARTATFVRPPFKRARIWLGFTVLTLLLSFTVATYPGEFLDRTVPEVRCVPAIDPTELHGYSLSQGVNDRGGTSFKSRLMEFFKSIILTSPHKILFEGAVDLVNERRTSFFSNTIVAPGTDLIDHSKYKPSDNFSDVKRTVSLRGRDLNGAVLIRSDLRHVDFTGAELNGSFFNDADLRYATFGCDMTNNQDQFQQDPLWAKCTELRGASLVEADLRGAALSGAELEGANLSYANLNGANLNQAQLQGAILDSAEVQGALLVRAQLQGASLVLTKLGAATLDSANLRGASIHQADLQGASLFGTDFAGAEFALANLQGAAFRDNNLFGASFEQVFVWRTILQTEGSGEFTRISSIHPEEIYRADDGPSDVFLPPAGGYPSVGANKWTQQTFVDLRHEIEMSVPSEQSRRNAFSRIGRLDPQQTLDGASDVAGNWAKLALSQGSEDDYLNAKATIWREIGCNSDTRFVIEGLIRNVLYHPEELSLPRLIGEGNKGPLALAQAFMDKENCSAAKYLTEADNVRLVEIMAGK